MAKAASLGIDPAFQPDRKARSFSENPSDAGFWPVPVDDLMPEIRRVLERLIWHSPANLELA